MLRGYRDGGVGGGGTPRHVGAFYPAPQVMVKGRKNVDHDTAGAGGAVLDGLPPRYGPMPILEIFRPVPAVPIGSLHDPGLPL